MRYAVQPHRGRGLTCARGFRRGPRRTAVDGVLIGSASGEVAVATGTLIDLGDIRLEVRAAPVIERALLEEPVSLVKDIETTLGAIVRRLGPGSEGVGRSGPEGGTRMDEGAFLKDYLPALLDRWDHPALAWMSGGVGGG